MKYAAWVIGLVVGVTGCSGTVGGDINPHPPRGGGGGRSSAAGGSAPGAAGLEDAGGDDDGGTGGYDRGIGGRNFGGGNNHGGGFHSGGGLNYGGASNHGGGLNYGGQGGSPPDYEPQPSCDSPIDAWVAFDSDAADFNRDLYVVRPDGSQLMRVTADPSVEKEPYFSPAFDLLSFTSDRSGSLQIYVMDLNTFLVTQVTHRTEGAEQPSFSADGQLIAFHSGPSVYTIKPDGTNETLIATGVDDFNAYYTPRFIENSQLVFDRNNEIDAINLDKTNPRYIVHNTTLGMKAPTVSPANNEVAYQTRCVTGEGWAVWTTPANVDSQVCSGRRVTPVHDPMDNMNASWGPEGMFAYERVDSATGVGRITLINRMPGSVACSLTAATADSRNANWSKVGQQIHFPTL